MTYPTPTRPWDEGLHWSLSLSAGPYGEPISLDEAKLQCKVETAVTDDDGLIGSLISAARNFAENDGRCLVTQTWRQTLDQFPIGTVIPLMRWPVQSISSIKYIDQDGAEQTFSSSNYRLDNRSKPARVELVSGAAWPNLNIQVNAVTVEFVAGERSEFTAAITGLLTLAFPAELPINGRVVRVSSSGTLPAGLSADTDYYIISASGSTCKLSTTSGGSAVTITNTGTGTHYIHGMIKPADRAAMKLMIGHWYINREAVVVERGIAIEVPLAAKALLDVNRIYA